MNDNKTVLSDDDLFEIHLSLRSRAEYACENSEEFSVIARAVEQAVLQRHPAASEAGAVPVPVAYSIQRLPAVRKALIAFHARPGDGEACAVVRAILGAAPPAQPEKQAGQDGTLLPVPFAIDTTHKNQAFVTLGFNSVEDRMAFVKATRCDGTRVVTAAPPAPIQQADDGLPWHIPVQHWSDTDKADLTAPSQQAAPPAESAQPADIVAEHNLREVIAALILESDAGGISQGTLKAARDAIYTPYRAAQVALLRGRAQDEEPRVRHTCDMGVGCEEAGVCYATAHGEPDRCGQPTAATADAQGDERARALAQINACALIEADTATVPILKTALRRWHTALSRQPSAAGSVDVWKPGPLENVANCLDASLRRGIEALRATGHPGDVIDASRLEYLRQKRVLTAKPLTAEDVERQYENGVCKGSGIARATCPCGFCAKHRYGFNQGARAALAAAKPEGGDRE